MWAVLGAGAAALVAAGTGSFAYLGGFGKIDVQEKTGGGLNMMLKLTVGPYKEVGKAFDETNQLCSLEEVRRTGVYYDDPALIAKEYGSDKYCRALIGIVMDDVPAAEKAAVEAKAKEMGYEPYSFPSGNCAYARFEIKSFPPLRLASIIIFVSKVYPALKAYFEEKKHMDGKLSKVVELYEGWIVNVYAPTVADVNKQLMFPVIEAVHPKLQVEKAAAAAADGTKKEL